MKYAVFDTETTGLSRMDEVIQFACIIANEQFKAVDYVNFFCYTQREISKEALDVHKIDRNLLYKLSGGQPFEDRIREFPELFHAKDITWVEYSTNGFDRRLVNQTLENNGHSKLNFGKPTVRLYKENGVWSFSICNALAALKFGGRPRKLTQAANLLPYTGADIDRMYKKYLLSGDSSAQATYHHAGYDAFVTWLLLYYFGNEFRQWE